MAVSVVHATAAMLSIRRAQRRAGVDLVYLRRDQLPHWRELLP